jgi:prepilin-type N-terminal cleavage/methylation domain-containing protein
MKQQQSGFTLVELLTAAAIILILTTFVLTNYPAIGRGFALERSAERLAQELRSMQQKSVSMEEVSGTVPKGYGIYFNTASPYSYNNFADSDGDFQWGEGVDTLLNAIDLESNVEIGSLESGGSQVDSLSIVFQPPDPTTWIGNSSSSTSTITLQLETDPEKTKTIYVNSAGLITTQ